MLANYYIGLAWSEFFSLVGYIAIACGIMAAVLMLPEWFRARRRRRGDF